VKLIYKILLVNIGIALFFAWLITSSGNFNFEEFAIGFGVISLVGGAIDILIAIILFVFRKKQWAQGYLITAGLLLLIGTAACSLSL
jgi:hypothetical protein